MKVTIMNWDKYNPRKDIKATTWFRAENSIFEDADFFNFTREELCFWFYLLSQASKRFSESFSLRKEHAERVAGFKKSCIDSAIEKLLSLQIITVDVTCTLRGRNADDTLRNERNVTNETKRNETNGIAQQVERMYQDLYPRKVGKTGGLKRLAREVGESDLPLLEKSILNYAKFVENKSPEYIKHFSTFAGEWRDWTALPEDPNDMDVWMRKKMEESKNV